MAASQKSTPARATELKSATGSAQACSYASARRVQSRSIAEALCGRRAGIGGRRCDMSAAPDDGALTAPRGDATNGGSRCEREPPLEIPAAQDPPKRRSRERLAHVFL